MKKIYLSAAILACSLLSAQSAFTWDVTSYKGAFPVTDNTTATDWTTGWANWDPENVAYSAPTSTLTGDVSTDLSLSGVVYLDGIVHVKNNAILTIAPGTVIRGKQYDAVTKDPGTLIISRGSKIMAQGTVSQPIVFTSIKSEAAGRNPGDWGGVIILGNGVTNTGGKSTNPNVSAIEGFVSNTEPLRWYGGTDDNDNSGVFSFVRIEFAGVALDALQNNSEINGLTMGGVGASTKIDHVQVSFCGDDAFEWFGGKVDAKYLIAYRCTDDDFDTDFGFRGRIQFGLGVKDPDIWDNIAGGESNGFESDNTSAAPFLKLPLTKPVFSNMTMIGAKGDGTVYGNTTLPIGEKHSSAMHIRRNSATSLFNSLILGFEQGLRFQLGQTQDNFDAIGTDSMAYFSNINVTAEIPSTFITNVGSASGTTLTAVSMSQTWYHNYASANNIDTVTTIAQIDFVAAFNALGTTPDFRLKTTSTASTGASFVSPAFVGGFTGVNEVSSVIANSFVVYPNPAKQNTTISFNIIDKNKVTVTVYDVLGNMVSTLSQSNDFEKGNNTINLNTSNLSNGIYYISLVVNGAKETKKLIINN
jgi:hypothetical protein